VISERAVTVVVSVVVVVLVAVLQERSRHLAAIIATMPLTAPLAMWIVFSASRGDQRQTADFVGSMLIGAVAAYCSCWRAGSDSAKLGFVLSLALASAIWLLVVLIRRWIDRSPS